MKAFIVLFVLLLCTLRRGLVQRCPFLPSVFHRNPLRLTHPLTHWTMGAYGNNGLERSKQHRQGARKGPDSTRKRRSDLCNRICNQQVGGSSPSTSSIVRRSSLRSASRGAESSTSAPSFFLFAPQTLRWFAPRVNKENNSIWGNSRVAKGGRL